MYKLATNFVLSSWPPTYFWIPHDASNCLYRAVFVNPAINSLLDRLRIETSYSSNLSRKASGGSASGSADTTFPKAKDNGWCIQLIRYAIMKVADLSVPPQTRILLASSLPNALVRKKLTSWHISTVHVKEISCYKLQERVMRVSEVLWLKHRTVEMCHGVNFFLICWGLFGP